MAVVVDRAFFDRVGEMDDAVEQDISNADIAWFIVKFEETSGESRTPHRARRSQDARPLRTFG